MSLMQQDVIETRIKDSPLQAPYSPGVRSYPYAVLIILPLTSAFNFLDRQLPKILAEAIHSCSTERCDRSAKPAPHVRANRLFCPLRARGLGMH
jgi:hypothetical protein